ncbi:MAG: Fe-S cluster protein [Deltaproteobacteria bacterium]|nr:Fe-S cluster protein [Deltaproteobacteria bacterium]
MLLNSYRKEIFRVKCNPSFESLHCIAHLDQDISEALPYLNSVLGGFEYLKNPLAVTFRIYGKLIAVHSKEIAINALKDEEEANKILEWLKKEINDAWEKRDEIEPRCEGDPKPKIFEILKLLPRTNCHECAEPTCMVFAARIAEGAKGPEDCPQLKEEERLKLARYMGQFQLGI